MYPITSLRTSIARYLKDLRPVHVTAAVIEELESVSGPTDKSSEPFEAASLLTGARFIGSA